MRSASPRSRARTTMPSALKYRRRGGDIVGSPLPPVQARGILQPSPIKGEGFVLRRVVSSGDWTSRSPSMASVRRRFRRAVRASRRRLSQSLISALTCARTSARPSSRRLSFAGSTRFCRIHSLINMVLLSISMTVKVMIAAAIPTLTGTENDIKVRLYPVLENRR